MAGIPDYPAASDLTDLVLLGDQAGATKSVPAALLNASLADSAVSTIKIANGAVTTPKLADAAVTSGKLADNAVTQAKVADAAIGTAELIDAAVTSGKLSDNAVATAKIAAGAVTDAKLADGAVTSSKIAVGAVSEVRLSDGAVTSGKLANGSVTSGKLADNAVTNAKVADGAIGADELAAGAVSTVKIADNAVTLAKLVTLAANKLIGRRSGSGGNAEEVTIGSGLSLSSTGVLSATAGGGATVPAMARVAYVDLASTGTGATIGGSAAFADVTVAYTAARAFLAANGGGFVTLHLGPGAHTLAVSSTQDAIPGVHIIGSGENVTVLNVIHNRADSAPLVTSQWRLKRMSASLDISAAYEPGYGEEGRSLIVEVFGDDVTLTLAAAAGAGGAGLPGDDGGTESPADGGPGGNAGALTVMVRGCRLSTQTYARGVPGVGGVPSFYGGNAGADGAYSSVDEFRAYDCPALCSYVGIQNFGTEVQNYTSAPNAMVARCSNSYLGTLGAMDYIMDNCSFMDASSALGTSENNNTRVVISGF